MLNFCSLYSGSSGNCLFIQTEKTKILVDCGTSLKKIQEGLINIGEKIEDIDAILVTHEHVDHVQSLGNTSKKFDIPVFANFETFEAMPNQKEKIELHNQKLFEIGEEFKIGDLAINSFSTPHDAANPVSYSVVSDDKKICVATDIGLFTPSIEKELLSCNAMLLEANHDVHMLEAGPYPYVLKRRILGDNGHLSNEKSMVCLADSMGDKTKLVLHAHVSQECNLDEMIEMTRSDVFRKMNINTDNIDFVILRPYASKEYEI